MLLPYFKDTTVTPQNLSDYRYGSFREWLKKEEQERRTRELAEYAVRIGAGPGVDLGRASAALLHSQLILLMEPMHSLITAMANGVHMEERIKLICEDMARLGQVLHLVRQGEHQAELLRLKAEQVAISRERLELAKAAQQLAREKWETRKMTNDQVPKAQGNPNAPMPKAAAGNTPGVQGTALAGMAKDQIISNEPISKVLAHGHQGEAKAWDNTGLLNDLGPVMFPKHWTGVEKPDSAYTPEELAARRRQQAEESAVSWARTLADQKYYNRCYLVAQQLITGAGAQVLPHGQRGEGAGALPSKLSPEVFAHLETPAALGRTEEEMRAVVAEVQQRAEMAVRFPIEQKIQLAAERAEYEKRTGLDALTGKPLAQGAGACARPPEEGIKMSNDQVPNVQGNPNIPMSTGPLAATSNDEGAGGRPPEEVSNDQLPVPISQGVVLSKAVERDASGERTGESILAEALQDQRSGFTSVKPQSKEEKQKELEAHWAAQEARAREFAARQEKLEEERKKGQE